MGIVVFCRALHSFATSKRGKQSTDVDFTPHRLDSATKKRDEPNTSTKGKSGKRQKTAKAATASHQLRPPSLKVKYANMVRVVKYFVVAIESHCLIRNVYCFEGSQTSCR